MRKVSSSLGFQLNFHNNSFSEGMSFVSCRMWMMKLGKTFILIKKLEKEREKNFYSIINCGNIRNIHAQRSRLLMRMILISETRLGLGSSNVHSTLSPLFLN